MLAAASPMISRLSMVTEAAALAISCSLTRRGGAKSGQSKLRVYSTRASSPLCRTALIMSVTALSTPLPGLCRPCSHWASAGHSCSCCSVKIRHVIVLFLFWFGQYTEAAAECRGADVCQLAQVLALWSRNKTFCSYGSALTGWTSILT